MNNLFSVKKNFRTNPNLDPHHFSPALFLSVGVGKNGSERKEEEQKNMNLLVTTFKNVLLFSQIS